MTLPINSFCPVSLGDWLQVCAAANVPYVPAQQITEVRKDDYLSWTDEGPVRDRLMAVYAQMGEVAVKDYMVRYDCCSSTELKYALAHGKPEWSEEFCYLTLDDPRVYAIVEEYPREVIPVWQRPWVKASVIDGYPVEYRVFVKDAMIVGISNYYPQRPLPYNREHMDAVRVYTLRLLRALIDFDSAFQWHSGFAFVAGRDKMNLNGVHFSADFIVSEAGDVSFLEGGPPHELGAHECCFRENEIEGLALSNRNEN